MPRVGLCQWLGHWAGPRPCPLISMWNLQSTGCPQEAAVMLSYIHVTVEIRIIFPFLANPTPEISYPGSYMNIAFVRICKSQFTKFGRMANWDVVMLEIATFGEYDVT